MKSLNFTATLLKTLHTKYRLLIIATSTNSDEKDNCFCTLTAKIAVKDVVIIITSTVNFNKGIVLVVMCAY
jgi:hypothetical protein